MSSHREAPLISRDPVADNTDVYAFRSPDNPSTVTLIANWIPLEEPAGGPNFFQFGDDVLYEIMIDNNGDGVENITYQFRFTNLFNNPNTFLYNTGPITTLDDPDWNIRQVYSVTRVRGPRRIGRGTTLATDLISPPVRIGPRSTPNYNSLANAAIHSLPDGEVVFAGQREEAFYVDLGSIFDLAALRPFQNLHVIPLSPTGGVDAASGYNVHSIAIQVPINMLTRDGSVPEDPMDPRAVIGVWATASRQRALVRDPAGGSPINAGPWVQVSRLGNPLINEVLIPVGKKDMWNASQPKDDAQFGNHYKHPELAMLLPSLYPSVFPNLASLNASGEQRLDLVAILLTGIPSGLISGFQNFTGSTPADMLRLNVAIPPATSPNPLGLIGGDPAGFPNGRRVIDDVVSIELRAVAGLTYPLVNPGFTPDSAAALLTDGTSNDVTPLPSFPYLGVPHEGFDHEHDHDA